VHDAIEIAGVSKRFGDVAAVQDVTLSVARGRVAALLGPSGSGKTTLLRLLAGFETPDAGAIRIAGREVAGPSAWVEPEDRRIGMLFQHGALFPHLDVAANVGFGATSREHARSCLELVGLTHRAGAFPHELSGGERQRVALARALAAEPSVVLLDEPFAALDPGLRERLREEVVAILRDAGSTALLVTHDQDEALSLADVVALMRDGRVEQVGTPEDVYAQPATRWSAEFLGDANLLPATRSNGVVECALGRLPAAGGPHGDVLAVVRPEAISAGGDGAEAVVVGRSFLGDHQVLRVELPGGELVRWRHPARGAPPPGARVRLRVDGDVAVVADDHAPAGSAR
jgi:iron(III) transport system ATP-binding protein